MTLIAATSPEHIEWLRVKRNDPALYKYFRQDTPITPQMQAQWWRNVDKNRIRLFIVEEDGKWVGYAGFNPFMQSAGRAEFGLFIITEEQGKGYGTKALQLLLKKGFEDYNLSTIYSDVLDYPGEGRFEFYKKIGFSAYPDEHQHIQYKKQGKWIKSIKFFMTKDMWRDNGKDPNGRLEPQPKKAVAAGKTAETKSKGSGFYPGKTRLQAIAK